MASHNESFQVLVHPYEGPAKGACAYELGNTSSRNAIIFVGGLSDGPHTVPYIRTVAKHLASATSVSYSVFEIRLRSAFTGFGTASLKDDVEDIAALVKHLRSIGKDKIVLFGHSTGCQDCMEYTNYAKHENPPVDGFILQAPVSDREGLDFICSDKAGLDLASDWLAQGKGDHCLPPDAIPSVLGKPPMSAYRLHSLRAKGGDDDYFSSDFDDETVTRIWGRYEKPVLVLHSGADEFVPPTVNQEALNERYRRANPLVSKLSGLIPEAEHAVLGDEAREWLAIRVIEFLKTLEH
ncbi:hypothetical protein HIM_07764 [Hirsutella minnesotensis 3608]|uniref:Uncharacterized protein n=1 Tax=Hirsutella minnesotensis 3608 TaxID=1043627 RepID=A0A0F7ZMY7_9HYPO|nr:hypothetical protein HIM_07764 [Hirsutella minnesotensis 3608]